MPLASFWSRYAWRPSLDYPSGAYLEEFVIKTKAQIEDIRWQTKYLQQRREIRLKHRGGDKRLWTRERTALRMRFDSNFRLANRIRQRLSGALKRQRGQKAFKTMDSVGCTIEQLWIHLEKQFHPGMTRENYGLWHVDHIQPCAAFDLRNPEEQKRCFHYSNLQPLWAVDNLRKNAKPPATSQKCETLGLQLRQVALKAIQ